MGYAETLGGTRYVFSDLKMLLARATPPRSGDRLAGVAAADMTERVAAQRALADLPLRRLIEDPVVPYETDEITRLIVDTHDGDAFLPITAMTVGELRDWLLSDVADTAALTRLAAGLTPEITTLAYSVNGGYTPLPWKFLGDDLALWMSGHEAGLPGRRGMDLLLAGAATEQAGARRFRRKPLGDDRLEHRLHLARRPRQQRNRRAAPLEP